MIENDLYEKMHKTADYRLKNQGIDLMPIWGKRLPISTCNKTILEVGCGNGILCKKLASMGWNVTGVDVVTGDYDRTGYDFKNLDICRAICYGEYDYVLCFDVFEHLKEVDVFSAIKAIAVSAKQVIIFSAACYGDYPLHLTVKTPGWWLDICLELCPEFNWEVLCAKNRYKHKSPITLLYGERRNGEERQKENGG